MAHLGEPTFRMPPSPQRLATSKKLRGYLMVASSRLGLEGSIFLGSLAVGDWNFRNPKWSKDAARTPPRMKFHIPGTQMTSMFEGQPPKTRPFPIKTKTMNEFHNGWWFLQDFEVINLREERSNLTSYS